MIRPRPGAALPWLLSTAALFFLACVIAGIL